VPPYGVGAAGIRDTVNFEETATADATNAPHDALDAYINKLLYDAPSANSGRPRPDAGQASSTRDPGRVHNGRDHDGRARARDATTVYVVYGDVP
jgi:hypothetical protein